MAAGRADESRSRRDLTMSRRTARHAPLAAAALALLAWVPGGPIVLDRTFAAAPAGRLVVTSRTDAPVALAVDGVASVRRPRASAHRPVVGANAGRPPVA